MAKEQQSFRCRLSLHLARDVPKAVILRKGPSEWVQLVLWHTDTDTFEEGQWFRGGIYSGYGDLSPDGSLFLYVARKARTPARYQSDYTHKWTAISKPPYFTALALWPVGDTTDGGGLFLNNHTVWLNHQSMQAHKNHQPKGLKIKASTEPDNFRLREKRDGWQLIQEGQFSFEKQSGWSSLGVKGITIRPYIWHKYDPTHQYRLVTQIYREPNLRRKYLHYVVDESNHSELQLEDVVWADWDLQGRLIFAREGQLFASKTAEEPGEVKMIADFHTNKPAKILAPEWATHW